MHTKRGMFGVGLTLLGLFALGFGALSTLLSSLLFLFTASFHGVEHAFQQVPVFAPFWLWCVLLPLGLGLVAMPIGVNLRRQWEHGVSHQLTIAVGVSLVILGYLLLGRFIQPLVMNMIRAAWPDIPVP